MITQQVMVESMKHVTSLDFSGKERLVDEIFIKQPNLLATVLVLSNLNIPAVKVEEVLFILLVLYEAFHKRSGMHISLVTEEMIGKANDNSNAMLKYLDKEGMAEGSSLIGKAMAESPYKFVNAFVIGHLNERGFSAFSQANEHCVRAAKIVMDCFIKAACCQ